MTHSIEPGRAPDGELAQALSIRAATPADRQALTRVVLSSRRAFISYAPLVHGEQDMAQWMGRLLAREGNVTVACVNDVAVGVLAVVFGRQENWIDQLYLAPGSTGLGIGTRLLAQATHLLTRRLPIRLYTFQANAGARRFYERAGFKAIAFGDGTGNEERCPDILYELAALP